MQLGGGQVIAASSELVIQASALCNWQHRMHGSVHLGRRGLVVLLGRLGAGRVLGARLLMLWLLGRALGRRGLVLLGRALLLLGTRLVVGRTLAVHSADQGAVHLLSLTSWDWAWLLRAHQVVAGGCSRVLGRLADSRCAAHAAWAAVTVKHP